MRNEFCFVITVVGNDETFGYLLAFASGFINEICLFISLLCSKTIHIHLLLYLTVGIGNINQY